MYQRNVKLFLMFLYIILYSFFFMFQILFDENVTILVDGSAVETNATGIVGQNVILPCGCSSVSSLVWQRGDTVVNGYPQEREYIDQAYIDRTELFLEKDKTDCSLMILNISSADAGVYTCHALFHVSDDIWSRNALEVNLTGELSKTEFIYPIANQ